MRSMGLKDTTWNYSLDHVIPPGTVYIRLHYTEQNRKEPFIKLIGTELNSMGPGLMDPRYLSSGELGTWGK